MDGVKVNPYIYVAAIAIGVFAVAEILAAYQKYLLKKQFLEQLDSQEEKRDSKEN